MVVNKCDGELVVPARRAAVAYSSALLLLRSVGALSDSDDTDSGERAPQWIPRVLKASALKGDGVCISSSHSSVFSEQYLSLLNLIQYIILYISVLYICSVKLGRLTTIID